MITPSTELDAVNVILRTLGEAPVVSLDGANVPLDAVMARDTLHEVSEDVQARGWYWNREYTRLSPNSAGEIPAPANALSIRPAALDVNYEITIRGKRLYRLSNEPNQSGFSFGVSVETLITYLLPLEDLPAIVRRYITTRAANLHMRRTLGDDTVPENRASEEAEALDAILQDTIRRHGLTIIKLNDTPANDLELVNALLVNAGEVPVASLDSAVPREADNILRLIRVTSEGLQSEGWEWNQEAVTLTPRSGKITLDRDVLDVRPLEHPVDYDLSIRGNTLYRTSRSIGHSGTQFDKAIKALLTKFISFTDLPKLARRYIFLRVINLLNQQKPVAEGTGEYTLKLFEALKAEEQQAYEALRADVVQRAALNTISLDDTPTTTLDALNGALGALGLNPVISLETVMVPEAIQLLRGLRQASETLQARGWYWNREMVRLDGQNGRIPVPDNITAVRTANRFEAFEVTIRDGLLYRLAVQFRDDGFKFSGSFDVEATILLAFENLPPMVRRYVMLKALRDFASQAGRNDIVPVLLSEEAQLMAEINADDVRKVGLTFNIDSQAHLKLKRR